MKVFTSFLFFLLCVSCVKKEPSSVVILKIGSVHISDKDFSLYLMDEAKNYNTIFIKDPAVIEKIKSKVVANLIIEELLLNWGRENKILLSSKKIDQKIQERIKSFPDVQAFKRVYSELKIQKKILQRRTQVTWVKDKLIESFNESFRPTNKEIKNYYYNNKKEFKQAAKVKLQQIVVKSQLEAKKLFSALKKGSSFAQLATDYSLGAESDNKGILGWVEKGVLPVFDAAFNLPLKRLSSPKKSPYGYHIFRVLKRKRGRQQPLNEVKEQISVKIKATAAKENYKNWLEKQIQLVKVEKNEEALRSIKIDVKSDS